MHIEFLISTMNRDNLDFLIPMFEQVGLEQINALIVNQCTSIAAPEHLAPCTDKIRVISLQDEGLSRSRNRLLREARGDVCILADDDVIYAPDCLQVIEGVYSSLDVAICAFYRKERKIKRGLYYCKVRDVLSISSVEISFRRAGVIDKGIDFDERFGLGSGQYEIAEESIWLLDCLRAKLKIMRYPYHAVSHPHPSSGARFDVDPMTWRGPVFKRMFGAFGYVVLFRFLLRAMPSLVRRGSFFRVVYHAVRLTLAYEPKK